MPTTTDTKAPSQRILHRYTGAVLFDGAYDTMRECVEAAAESSANLIRADLSGADLSSANLSSANLSGAYLIRANLSDADLSDADLSGANLSGADLIDVNLSGANLSGANLSGAYLIRANLSDADLSDADLSGANLIRADLSGADLSSANLSGAYLSGANLSNAALSGANLSNADLSGAYLSDANLSGADLRSFRTDLFDVLLRAIPEVPGVLAALCAGNVDGSTYTGPCACLVGTIANLRGVSAESIDYRDHSRPAEQWFATIRAGDTPATNAAAKLAEEWIEEFQALVPAARGEG